MKLLAGRFAGTIPVYCALRQPVNPLNAVLIDLANDLAMTTPMPRASASIPFGSLHEQPSVATIRLPHRFMLNCIAL